MTNQKQAPQKLINILSQKRVRNPPSLFRSKSQRNKKKKLTSKQCIQGHWNFQEKLNCLIFIQSYQSQFNSGDSKRLWKLFKQMSEYIKSRNCYQCRSHYQKMMNKFHNVQDMVECMKSSFSEISIKKAQRIFLQYKSTIKKAVTLQPQRATLQIVKKQIKEVKEQVVECQDNQIQKQSCESQKNTEVEVINQLQSELGILQQMYNQQMLFTMYFQGYNHYNPIDFQRI